jgi:hypothetical protein
VALVVEPDPAAPPAVVSPTAPVLDEPPWELV